MRYPTIEDVIRFRILFGLEDGHFPARWRGFEPR